MTHLANIQKTGLVLWALLLVAGCGGKKADPVVPKDPSIAISCIGVLPARTTVDFDRTVSVTQAKQLKEGARMLDQLLRQELSSVDTFRFVSPATVSGLESNNQGNGLERAQAIGAHLSCNALLETTISRYADRVGSQYSAEEPASVAFEYTLYEVEKGRVLCQGQFDEIQKSVMENLYNWSRASSRGFKWITAEQMLREGVHDKFSRCSYLVAD